MKGLAAVLTVGIFLCWAMFWIGVIYIAIHFIRMVW